jgi:hypothetical protein
MEHRARDGYEPGLDSAGIDVVRITGGFATRRPNRSQQFDQNVT